jgi:tRNA A58 N-methylase Trm61
MSNYVLGHDLKGEALMSQLLDPMHQRYIDALGVVRPGARTLEVGCGKGSISEWLAEFVRPGGTAVAVDLDLSLVDLRKPNFQFMPKRHRCRSWGARDIRSGEQHVRCFIMSKMPKPQWRTWLRVSDRAVRFF